MEQDRLEACQQAIGYTFREPFWLQKALTHSSNRTDLGLSNERLEFLGDAVLGMIISEHLFHKYLGSTEGELTAIKSVVVSQRTLVRHSLALGLNGFLSVGRGMGDPSILPRSVVANVFEAIVGAIFLDSGLEAVREFILGNLAEDIELAEQSAHEQNFKSLLQQLAQRDLACTPTYRVKEEAGPDHAKSFRVVTVINGAEYGTGWGPNKKEAEQRSARESLAMLKAHLAERQGADAAKDAPAQEDEPAT